MYSKMKNNLVELLPDPIFSEFESSSDKDAALKLLLLNILVAIQILLASI